MSEPAPRRLLIIDDEDEARALFTAAMEAAGFSVAAADHGAAGVALARTFRPHLIVLDLVMPGLDGLEVLHRLQVMGLERVPVIVITAYSRRMSEELVRQEPNVVDFVRKPIQYDALTERVRGLLGRADGQASPA